MKLQVCLNSLSLKGDQLRFSEWFALSQTCAGERSKSYNHQDHMDGTLKATSVSFSLKQEGTTQACVCSLGWQDKRQLYRVCTRHCQAVKTLRLCFHCLLLLRATCLCYAYIVFDDQLLSLQSTVWFKSPLQKISLIIASIITTWCVSECSSNCDVTFQKLPVLCDISVHQDGFLIWDRIALESPTVTTVWRTDSWLWLLRGEPTSWDKN